MNAEFIRWAALCLVFLAAFFLSLLHASLSTSSKISVSRFLEDKEKEDREKVLDLYDEIKIAVESLRMILLIGFFVLLHPLAPAWRLRLLGQFLIFLAVYFIFFEYLPRLLNSLNRKPVLSLFLSSFKLVRVLGAPLIALLRRLEAGEPEEDVRETSDEEIETFIDEAKEEGIIEKDEDVLLRSVVQFGDIVVREIMTPRMDMVCIRKDATIDMLRELVIKEKYSRIPVYKDKIDNIEGQVIVKDLLPYTDETHKGQPIEPLIRPVYFVPESMKVYELLREFQKRKLKMAIVVDEHGGVSGLVTMEDLVEEIVGEIRDEYDVEESHITQTGPFDYVVSGDVEVDRIEKIFDLDLAEDNYITISGLITHDLGRLPKRGETLLIKGLTFEILDVDQKRVTKLKIKKPGPKLETEDKGKKANK